MKDTILVLSCLNGRVAAVAFQKGVAAGRWDSPESVEDFAGFGETVKMAVLGTGFEGSAIMVVLAHAQLTSQMEEVPNVKGRALETYLERRVARLKNPEEKALWSYQPALPGKNVAAVIVHVCPEALINQIVAGCEAQKLGLQRIVPVPSVLASFLGKLDLAKGEVGLLAAEMAGTTTVVVGDATGGIHLARMVPQTWRQGADRLVIDLNRTVLFAKQQYGASVDTMWLYGNVGAEQLAGIQERFTFPVKACPLAYDSCGVALAAAELPTRQDGNLLRSEQREGPARRLRRKVVMVVVAGFAVVALLAAGYTRLVFLKKVVPVDDLAKKVQVLQGQRDEAKQRSEARSRQQSLIQLLEGPPVCPLPHWLLASAADLLPPDLFLTKLHLQWEAQNWKVQLGGHPCVLSNLSPAQTLAQQVPLFTNRLAASPFFLKFSRCAYGITNPPLLAKRSPTNTLWQGLRQTTQEAVQATPSREVSYFEVEGTTR